MSNFSIDNVEVSESVNQTLIIVDHETTQTIIGAGTINVSPNILNVYIVNNGGFYNITLPNGITPGQQKTIIVTSRTGLDNQNITLLYNDAYGDPQQFIFANIGDMFYMIATTLGWQIIYSLQQVVPVVLTQTFVQSPSHPGMPYMLFEGQVVSQGTFPVIERGVIYSDTDNPVYGGINVQTVIYNSSSGIDNIPFSITFYSEYQNLENYARSYAINSFGIGYGEVYTATPAICLAKGTLITLSDGTNKLIEEIEYSDLIKVWNFDDCKFDIAEPLWIMKKYKTNTYNLLEFSDGSILKTINQHRIFNKEKGSFTYPMTDDTPIGTTTFNVNGNEISLVKKHVKIEITEYYNIITKYHINLFANGILTSCRYNNIYPIKDMAFVKYDKNIAVKEDDLKDIPKKYIDGLRLKDQQIPIKDTIKYIFSLELRKK